LNYFKTLEEYNKLKENFKFLNNKLNRQKQKFEDKITKLEKENVKLIIFYYLLGKAT
jgi:hypothetical protein